MAVATIGDNTGDTYSGLEDTRVDNDGGAVDDTFGTHVNGFCGSNGSGRILKDLQRFDLSGLTSGWTVTGTVLYLYDLDWAPRTADCTINVYQIASANGDWIEGTTTDETEVGSPCWNKKEYNTVNWAGSVGLSTAGTDYVNTSLGSAVFTDGVSGYRTITFNATGEGIIEGWLGDATNDGLLLVGTGSGATWTQWDSSQGTDGQRPYLSVTYTVAAGFQPAWAQNSTLTQGIPGVV